jgi:LysM repeat protein
MSRNAIMGAVSGIVAALILLLGLLTAIPASPVAVAATVSYVTGPAIQIRLSVAVVTERSYKIRPGDTLSALAGQYYGNAGDWPAIYDANRSQISDPNVIMIGWVLTIPASPKYTYAPPVVSNQAPSNPPPPTYEAVDQQVNPDSYSGFQSCVIARESGGNSQAMNASGHYGLYQFSLSTWEEYGGSAYDFGNASVAEQNQVFANAMARDGEFNWSKYDGC